MSPPSGKYIIRCRNELVGPNVHEPSFPGKATKVYHGTHGISPVWNLQLMPDKRYVLSNVGGQARDIHGLLYTQVLGPDATMHWDLVPMERAGPHMYQIVHREGPSWHVWAVEESPQVAVVLTLRLDSESNTKGSIIFEITPVLD